MKHKSKECMQLETNSPFNTGISINYFRDDGAFGMHDYHPTF